MPTPCGSPVVLGHIDFEQLQTDVSIPQKDMADGSPIAVLVLVVTATVIPKTLSPRPSRTTCPKGLLSSGAPLASSRTLTCSLAGLPPFMASPSGTLITFRMGVFPVATGGALRAGNQNELLATRAPATNAPNSKCHNSHAGISFSFPARGRGGIPEPLIPIPGRLVIGPLLRAVRFEANEHEIARI